MKAVNKPNYSTTTKPINKPRVGVQFDGLVS